MSTSPAAQALTVCCSMVLMVYAFKKVSTERMLKKERQDASNSAIAHSENLQTHARIHTQQTTLGRIILSMPISDVKQTAHTLHMPHSSAYYLKLIHSSYQLVFAQMFFRQEVVLWDCSVEKSEGALS